MVFEGKPEGDFPAQDTPKESVSPKADTFKKRPCGPVLKDDQQNPPAPGAPRGWVTASLVPAAACHFANTQKRTEHAPSFFSAIFLPRPVMVKNLPHSGEFRQLRRATRRCPPWTRTGLMSGDRKATRYWALGFEHGAAPAETSPAPVRQRPGNRPALYPSGLQAPTGPPHTVKPRSGE